MPQPPLDPKLAQQAQATLATYNGNVSLAAAALGIPRSTLQSRLRTADTVPSLAGDSVSGSGDNCEITKTTSERVRTLADLVRVCEVDTTEWVIERWICNKWDSAAKLGKDTTERIAVTELYQVKVWLKRNAGIQAAKVELADVIAAAKRKIVTPSLPRKRVPSRSGNCAEVSLFDLHVGMLAWGKETGWENYDSRIAEERFTSALQAILERIEPFRPELIWFPIGNDLLHYDTKQIATTAGTPQSADGRYHKMFQSVRRMITKGLNDCRQIAPVVSPVVPGNHDTLGAYHLGDSLECYFHTAKDVTIKNDPTTRKYEEWGNAMVLFTHGNKGKRQDYPLLMAREQPEMWARTKYREVHTGHYHQTQVQEFHGVRVRILPSLCSSDAWHSENMYVGNLRQSEAFVWNKAEGLISTALWTVPDAERVA